MQIDLSAAIAQLTICDLTLVAVKEVQSQKTCSLAFKSVNLIIRLRLESTSVFHFRSPIPRHFSILSLWSVTYPIFRLQKCNSKRTIIYIC
jgi:hypothetical protein